jgi:hypothetical protein
MTIPQAVELVRADAPTEVTAEQIAGLRELIERTPACLPLLGGRGRVDRFIQLAARVQAEADAEKEIGEPSGDTASGTHAVGTPAQDPVASRHIVELGLLAGGALLLVAIGSYFLLGLTESASHHTSQPSAATSVRETSQQASIATATSPSKQQKKGSRAQSVRSVDEPVQDADPVWNGWHVDGSPGAIIANKTVWNLADPAKQEAATVMVMGSKPATLRADKEIDAAHRSLRIELVTADAPVAGTLEILADGKVLSRVKVDASHIGAPLLLPLDSCLGRRAKLEVCYKPESTASAIGVKTLLLAAQSTRVPWTPLKPASAISDSGTSLTVLPNDSVLATGETPATDAYHVTVSLPAEGATAIRLDALPDASLPQQGPGRGEGGEFLLYRFTAVRTASIKKLDQVPARHVRIELFGPPRALTLAEVEVFSGGENVARKKKASQSSTMYGRHAGLAIDGNKNNEFKRGSVTHTGNDANGWWSVDLGQETVIEKIVVWNRGNGCHEPLANHRMVVTDDQGKIRWQHENPFAPLPNVAYGPFVLEEERLAFTAVAVDGSSPGSHPGGMLKDDGPPGSGWTGRGAGQVSTAVFTLANALPGAEQITLHLLTGGPGRGSLGRLRLWSTSAPAPHQAEPAVIMLPTTH